MGLPGEPIIGKEIYADGIDTLIGGGTIPSGIALKRLGLDVGIHIQLGNDFFSAYAQNILLENGFDPYWFRILQQSLQRLTVSLSYKEDRAFVSYADPAPKISESNRYDISIFEHGQVNHLHFAHLSAALMADEVINYAKQNGISISSDCGWNPWVFSHPRLHNTLTQFDLFLPSEIEAMQITGTMDLTDACKRLATDIPLLVVKRGSKGALAYSQQERISVPAIEVDAIETTSAGDCFNAGFLFGWLQDWPLARALMCGNICGGLSTLASGWRATPTRQELEAWLEEYSDV